MSNSYFKVTAHIALPSEAALIGNSRLTAVNLTMSFSFSLASVASPGKWTIWPDGEREPKSKSRFNKELNDEPYR